MDPKNEIIPGIAGMEDLFKRFFILCGEKTSSNIKLKEF
jgi:hypothetical protein